MGKFAIIIIIAIVFVLIGGGYLVFSNFFSSEPPPKDEAPTEPPATPEATPTTPPAPPKESAPPPEPPPAPSIEEKVVDFGQAVADVLASGESQEVTLVFTEAEVNEQATKLLAQVEIPEDIPLEIKSVHIDLQPGNNLLTEAETTILGFGVTLKANAQVSIREGKPKVDITKVSFGAIPIPGAIKDAVVGFITQQTDDLLVQLTKPAIDGDGIDLEFQEINTQEDKVTITILVKKAA
jgi:flagellar basal body-associated protein FliL